MNWQRGAPLLKTLRSSIVALCVALENDKAMQEIFRGLCNKIDDSIKKLSDKEMQGLFKNISDIYSTFNILKASIFQDSLPSIRGLRKEIVDVVSKLKPAKAFTRAQANLLATRIAKLKPLEKKPQILPFFNVSEIVISILQQYNSISLIPSVSTKNILKVASIITNFYKFRDSVESLVELTPGGRIGGTAISVEKRKKDPLQTESSPRSEIPILNGKFVSLEEHEQLKKQLDDCLEKLEATEIERDERGNEIEMIRNDLSNDIAEKERIITQLNEELDQSKSNEDNANYELRKMTENFTKLKQELQETSMKLSETQDKNAQLTEELDTKTEQIAEMSVVVKQTQKLEVDLKEKNVKVKSFDEYHTYSEKVIARNEAKLKSQKQTIKKQKSEIESLNETIEKLKTEIDENNKVILEKTKTSIEQGDTIDEMKAKMREIDAAKAEVKASQTRCFEYEETIKKMQKELSENAKGYKKYKARSSNIEAELKKKTEQLKQTANTLTQLQDHHKVTSQKLKVLQKALQKTGSDSGNQALIQKLEKQKEKVSKSVEIIKDLKSKITAREQRINEMIVQKQEIVKQLVQYNILCENLMVKLGRNDVNGAMEILNDMYGISNEDDNAESL